MNRKLIIAIMLLLAVTAGLAAYLSQKPKEIEEIDTSDWRVYRNEEYEFEVKFPNTWEGYEVESGKKIVANYESQKYSYKYVRFTHLQKVSSKGRPGKICFDIGIFDDKNWQLAYNWNKLDKRNGYVYGWYPCNSAVPDDMHERASEIQFILRTFKLL